MIWIEESSITIRRDRDFSWLFTTARHAGHLTHVIGQDGSSLTPGMRQQLGTIYLFRCQPDLAETWSRQFCDPTIAAEAPTLQRFEFLVAGPFVPVRRCRLDLSQNDTIKTGIMKTLTVTAARAKLGYWLKRAERGEEIGILCGASLFPLRKAPIEAGDYMEQEYGLTKEEADRAAKRIIAESARDRAAGRLIPIARLGAAVAARRKAKGDRHARRAA